MSASSSLSSEPEFSLYKDAYESVKKHPSSELHVSPIITTAQPPRKTNDEKPAEKESICTNDRINKLIEAQTSFKELAPSFPSQLAAEIEEVHDEETEFSMSKLIRQASLNSSTMATAKAKIVTPISTSLAEDDKDQETSNMADESPLLRINPQALRSKLRTQKSLNDLKMEELKSVRDMAAKKSTDDIKVQIKFWAKAVASNMRQEG